MKTNSNRIRKWITLLAIVLAASVLSQAGCGRKTPEIARLTIIYSGDIEGFLKNCGCSGGQVGGEKRKARLLRMEREEALRSIPLDRDLPAEVLVLDVGNFTNYDSPVWELYSDGVVQSMALLDYDMVGLGHHELEYPQEELWELLGETGMPFTAANLRFTAPREGADLSAELNSIIEKFRIVELPSGYRVGLIHVVDTGLDENIRDTNGIVLNDAPQIAAAILEDNRDKADFWILSAASTGAKGISSAEIAALSELKLVIGFLGNNPLEDPKSTSVTYPFYLNKPFSKAKSVGKSIVTYSRSDMNRFHIKAEHLLLNANIKPDEDVQAIIGELQPLLEDLELETTRERLQVDEPLPHYIGQDECAMCHTEIYDFLEYTRHRNAYESLIEKDQQRSSACLPCHVTGHGTKSGWDILHKDEDIIFEGVSCENCHGPGSYHAEAMWALGSGEDYELPGDFSEDGRNVLGLRDVDVSTCRTCHDQENSVTFSYRTYYPKIDHTDLAERGVTRPPEDEEDEHDDHGSMME